MRKFSKWLITLTCGMFVLPFGACLSASVDGVLQSFQPCDVLNCQDPTYFDPCLFIECGREGGGGGDAAEDQQTP